MTFAGAAAHHQGVRAHEARPNAPYGIEAAFGDAYREYRRKTWF